jgi:hypothetical protein
VNTTISVLKVELHTHTSDDPIDRIPHSTVELIDHAATLGYHALAITLHEKQLDLRQFQPYAADRGIVLIPGVERTIEGRHVLLLNFHHGAEKVRTFQDLHRLKRDAPGGLVVAPHPFFPTSTCLWSYLDRHRDLFDAVEVNAMFTTAIDFNRRAACWAVRHGKPLVGNCDVHRLRQLGSTYSLVDAAPEPDAICEAIAAGRVQVERCALTLRDAAAIMAAILLGGRLPAGTSRDSQTENDPVPIDPAGTVLTS